MQVSVQKLTRTTWPRSSAASSGSEFTHPVAPASEGMCTCPESVTRNTILRDACGRAREVPGHPPGLGRARGGGEERKEAFDGGAIALDRDVPGAQRLAQAAAVPDHRAERRRVGRDRRV